MNKHEPWQLTGDAAVLYERYVARHILAPWAPLLVDAGRVAVGERVLDVACGTGVVARAAWQRVGPAGHVVGVDLNPGMIAVARSLPTSASAAIEWIEGSALDLPLADASVDVVLCQQGLQFFPDRIQALREMRRVLRLGGRLAFTVWSAIDDTPYQAALADALTRHVSPEAGAMARAPHALHDATEMYALVASAGFRNVQVRPTIATTKLPLPEEFVPGHLAALPIAQAITQLPHDRRARPHQRHERSAPRLCRRQAVDGTGRGSCRHGECLTPRSTGPSARVARTRQVSVGVR